MSEELKTNLKKRASAWAGQLTKLARGLAPNHVKPAISSHVEVKEDGKYIIRIVADRKIAPDARAQEYGSGLQSKRGPKEKYPIFPKTKKVLAFGWDVLDQVMLTEGPMGVKSAMRHTTKFAGIGNQMDENGNPKYLFHYVEHPGIEAANGGQGYIAPAVRELKARAREELNKDIKDAITSDIRRSFGKKAR